MWIACKFASETDDETDIELVNLLWRFLERETRDERKGRGIFQSRGAWQLHFKQTSLAPSPSVTTFGCPTPGRLEITHD